MFLHTAEMHIKLMQMLQQRSKRRSLRHLGKSVHVFGEAFATIAVETMYLNIVLKNYFFGRTIQTIVET